MLTVSSKSPQLVYVMLLFFMRKVVLFCHRHIICKSTLFAKNFCNYGAVNMFGNVEDHLTLDYRDKIQKSFHLASADIYQIQVHHVI